MFPALSIYLRHLPKWKLTLCSQVIVACGVADVPNVTRVTTDMLVSTTFHCQRFKTAFQFPQFSKTVFPFRRYFIIYNSKMSFSAFQHPSLFWFSAGFFFPFPVFHHNALSKSLKVGWAQYGGFYGMSHLRLLNHPFFIWLMDPPCTDHLI